MKLGFCGSRPSAIHATLTPAPVMPSDAAVGRCELSDAVWVSDSPSGTSCGLTVHAPGITFGVAVVALALAGLARGAAATGALLSPKLAWIVASGMTWAIAGLAFSRATSPAETVAATALIVWYCLTWEA